MSEKEEYIKIVDLDNETEAQLIKMELEKRDIPHDIKNYFDVAFDGIFQMQKGWGVVEAPPDYENKILEIYDDLTSEDKS